MKKRLITSTAAAAVVFTMAFTPLVSAANLGDKQFVSKKADSVYSYQKSSTYENCSTFENCEKPHRNMVSFQLLAKLTGKSVDALQKEYPQKTPWQIAKTLGKLDELKKAYLDYSKSAIDSLVKDKRITREDGDKMYADIEKRITAIDGVNIVIPGRPTFRPQFKAEQSA